MTFGIADDEVGVPGNKICPMCVKPIEDQQSRVMGRGVDGFLGTTVHRKCRDKAVMLAEVRQREGSARASGRTFRMLLTAIEQASVGKRVFVAGFRDHYAKDLAKTAARMCEAYCPGTCKLIMGRDGLVLQFPNEGQIAFGIGDRIRGRNMTDVFFEDHFTG